MAVKNLKQLIWLTVFAAIPLSLSPAGELPLTVEQGWIRGVPASSDDSAAYMTLINNSDQPLRLTSGGTSIAQMVMPMVTTRKGKEGHEMMGMQQTDGLMIPAHGRLTLAPDGDHLMLMGLKEHPKPGAKVKLTLRFQPGDKEIQIELPVASSKP